MRYNNAICETQKTSEESKSHGGKRAGAGRKPISRDGAMRSVGVRLTETQFSEFVRRGGASWLRSVLSGSEDVTK